MRQSFTIPRWFYVYLHKKKSTWKPGRIQSVYTYVRHVGSQTINNNDQNTIPRYSTIYHSVQKLYLVKYSPSKNGVCQRNIVRKNVVIWGNEQRYKKKTVQSLEAVNQYIIIIHSIQFHSMYRWSTLYRGALAVRVNLIQIIKMKLKWWRGVYGLGSIKSYRLHGSNSDATPE